MIAVKKTPIIFETFPYALASVSHSRRIVSAMYHLHYCSSLRINNQADCVPVGRGEYIVANDMCVCSITRCFRRHCPFGGEKQHVVIDDSELLFQD